MVTTIVVVIVVLFAIAVIATRARIHIIVRKEPDMATIKERLAALEATVAGHVTAGAATVDQVTALSNKLNDLALTVGDRLDAIDAEIGSDPAPVSDAQPAPDAQPADAAVA